MDTTQSYYETALPYIEKYPEYSLILGFIILIWIIEFINIITRRYLDSMGIKPRTLSGIKGIILSPFIHGSMSHTMANTTTLVIIGYSLCNYSWIFILTLSICVSIISGILVWICARQSSHIGASSMIFGFAGFLIYTGFLEKSWSWDNLSLITILIYGRFLTGIFPIEKHISWEGHLFGLLTGIGLVHFDVIPQILEKL